MKLKGKFTLYILSLTLLAHAQSSPSPFSPRVSSDSIIQVEMNQADSISNPKVEVGAYDVSKFSDDGICEVIHPSFGKRTIRIERDSSICFPALMKNKKNCFIVMSKKDYYLYVYESQGKDTVMLARFDCAFALKKGDKTRQGDMRTPHCVDMSTPFHISEIKNSSAWRHDFGDGRGNILSYGKYFLRLKLNGHKVVSNRSIGIHGSTNNEESVPGRASEGCIRLSDRDIITLREKFVTLGMKVFIKEESMDDLPFEINAMRKQGIERKRHLNPQKTLTNEMVNKSRLGNIRR